MAKRTSTPKATKADNEAAEARASLMARNDADDDGDDNDGMGDNAPLVVVSGEDGDRPPPSGMSFEDDPRNSIAKDISANRGKKPVAAAADGDDEEEGGEGPDTAVIIEAGANTAEVEEEDEPAPAVTPAAGKTRKTIKYDDVDPDTVVIAKVNGREVEIPLSELVGNAQKYQAGDEFLRLGKDLLDKARTDNARATAEDGTRPAGQNQAERRSVDPNAAAKPTAEALRAAKRAYLEATQTGTMEEAESAFDEYERLRDLATNGAANQGDVAELVDAKLMDREVASRAQAEGNAALTSLASKHYPALTDDDLGPGILKAGFAHVTQALVDIGVPKESFAGRTQMDVMENYARLRQDARYRDQLPSLIDVFEPIVEKVEKKYRIPQGAAPDAGGQREQQRAGSAAVRVSEDRVLRRTTTTTQPRPAGIRSQPPTTDAPRTRDTSSTIDRMKADREGIAVRR